VTVRVSPAAKSIRFELNSYALVVAGVTVRPPPDSPALNSGLRLHGESRSQHPPRAWSKKRSALGAARRRQQPRVKLANDEARNVSEILDNREHARSLRRRLNDHTVDLELLAQEAAVVFQNAGMAAHVRWLDFERQGYTWSAEARTLHEALGLLASDRLVVHIKAYRVQRAHVVDGNLAPRGSTIAHFFVEPIAEVARTRLGVRTLARGQTVDLDFPPGRYRGATLRASFAADVFDRILLGLRAALHLQLATVAQ
jgi:hypothetical protein